MENCNMGAWTLVAHRFENLLGVKLGTSRRTGTFFNPPSHKQYNNTTYSIIMVMDHLIFPKVSSFPKSNCKYNIMYNISICIYLIT